MVMDMLDKKKNYYNRCKDRCKDYKTSIISYLARAYRCKTVARLPLQNCCRTVAELNINTKNVSDYLTVACNGIATLFTVALHRVYIIYPATTTTVSNIK